jgi:hypothetical protein
MEQKTKVLPLMWTKKKRKKKQYEENQHRLFLIAYILSTKKFAVNFFITLHA